MYYHPKPAASHAAALRPGQLRHGISVASVTGRQPIRDVMLLWLTHSTGVHVTELAIPGREEGGDQEGVCSGAVRPKNSAICRCYRGGILDTHRPKKSAPG